MAYRGSAVFNAPSIFELTSRNKERVCGPCAMEQSQLGESGSDGDERNSQSESEDSRSRDGGIEDDTVEIPAMRSLKWRDPDKLVLGPADLEGILMVLTKNVLFLYWI